MVPSEWIVIVSISAALAAGAAAILLYFASLTVPHDKLSWKGQTPFEVSFRKRQSVYRALGFSATVIAIACSIWVAVGT